MDPITLGLSVVGIGLQLFGGLGQADVSHQQAKVSQDIAAQEQGINAQKQQQMQLESRRSLLQNFRNAQRLRSQATSAAVNQGALYGSGLPGGLAGITDTETESALGINQATEIGTNIFALNNKISADKSQLAALGGQAAYDQALGGIGGLIGKNAGTFGGLAKDVGSDISSGFGSLKWLIGGPTGFLG